MAKSMIDKIRARIPEVQARNAEAATKQAEVEAAEQQAALEEQQRIAKLEQRAMKRGQQLNCLLDDYPHIRQLPLYMSEVVGKGPPQERTDPVGDTRLVRDDVIIYAEAGTIRPLCLYGRRSEQLSLGDDGTLYAGIGSASDLHPRRQDGKMRKAELGVDGAYDMKRVPPERAIAIMDSGDFQDSMAQLLTQTGGYSDKISDQREIERRRAAQLGREAAEQAAEEARKAAEEAAKRSADEQELADRAQAIETLVTGLGLEVATAQAYTNACYADGYGHEEIFDIHDTRRAQKQCHGHCAEDRAVAMALAELQAAEYQGCTVGLQVSYDSSGELHHYVTVTIGA